MDNAYKSIDGFNSSQGQTSSTKGDDNDDDILEYLRKLEILSAACYFGHRHCIGESIRKFQNWLQSPNPDKDNQ